MRANKVFYEKCFNLGNFQHEKIAIELEVESGNTAEEVFKKAKEFVEKQHGINSGCLF